MDELVKSIDALSRDQVYLLIQQAGLQSVMVPVLLPGECAQDQGPVWECRHSRKGRLKPQD